MEGFMRIGVTIACFCEAGNLAEASDALTSFANIGGIVSGIDLTSHVGSGSRLLTHFPHGLKTALLARTATQKTADWSQPGKAATCCIDDVRMRQTSCVIAY